MFWSNSGLGPVQVHIALQKLEAATKVITTAHVETWRKLDIPNTKLLAKNEKIRISTLPPK